jgi:hypothetical protein
MPHNYSLHSSAAHAESKEFHERMPECLILFRYDRATIAISNKNNTIFYVKVNQFAYKSRRYSIPRLVFYL